MEDIKRYELLNAFNFLNGIKLKKLNRDTFIEELINAEVDTTPQIFTVLEILFK